MQGPGAGSGIVHAQEYMEPGPRPSGELGRVQSG